MIRSDAEYERAMATLADERRRLQEHARTWRAQGYTDAQVAKLLEPLESFHRQFAEEVRSYERLKRGEFAEFDNLRALGRVLIGLRISQGLTQRQLAERLGVNETMVSRDERNEYHGITVDRAIRVLDALRVRLVTRVELDTGLERGSDTGLDTGFDQGFDHGSDEGPDASPHAAA